MHIDNNISERTLKLIGIGRNNWLFLGSDQGGKTAAVLFSFTATCKHLGIDTFAYLRDVLTRLPTRSGRCPACRPRAALGGGGCCRPDGKFDPVCQPRGI